MGFKSWPPGGCSISGCTCTATPPPGTIILTPCICNVPTTLHATVSYVNGATAATYQHVFADSTLAYTTTRPAYLPTTSAFAPGLYSTATWLDDFGQECYYRFACVPDTVPFYALQQGQQIGGVWQNPSTVFSYFLSTPGNACTPFLLSAGTAAPGNPDARWVVSG